jgi:hypothetical protein
MAADRSGGSAEALWYVGPGRAEIRHERLGEPGPSEVRIRALYSAISRGTERLVFAGRIPETEFERMRAPFMGGAFPFPVKYGYAMVGRVERGPVELRDRIVFALHPRVALEESQTPWEMGATPAPAAAELGIDTAKIDEAIGFKGRNNNGVYQFGVPRSDSIKQDGMAIPGAMGTAIAINFQPTGDGKAAITGDFVALAGEVNPLVKALRDNGIEVTAIHNHMLDDEPRVFFVHFWANDDAVKLAKGLRAALDAVHVAPNG